MRKLGRFRRLAATLAAASLLLVAAPAYAQHGAADNVTAADDNTSQLAGPPATQQSTENEAETSRQKLADDRQQVKSDRQELKQDKKDAADANKQKRCESHKQGLETRSTSIVTNAQRAQDRISAVLDKAVAYQQANNVTVANWDSLVAAADSAKADSASAIASLSAAKPSIDCNSTSVASDVSAFKTVAATARDKLKAYRSAVKAVVHALLDAKEAASSDNTGGTQQ